MIKYIAWRGIVRHSKNRYVLRFYPAICKNNVHLAKTFIRKQNYINNKKLFVLHRDIQSFSSLLQTGPFVQVQISKLPGRVDAESHLVIVVYLPPSLLVLDVAHVVAGVAGGPHVRNEGCQ